jgi:hypothetical protein
MWFALGKKHSKPPKHELCYKTALDPKGCVPPMRGR